MHIHVMLIWYLCAGSSKGSTSWGQDRGLHAGRGCAEWVGKERPGESQYSTHPGHHWEGSAGAEQVERRWSLYPAQTQWCMYDELYI